MIGVGGRADADRFEEWVVGREVDGFDHIVDPDGLVWKEFDITSQPAFVFINDDGSIESRPGAMGLEGLTERITALIAA